VRDIGHVHDWSKRRTTRDHCHFQVVERTCSDCGATDDIVVERNFNLNPMQVAFAREDCWRCRQLLIGNEPASWGAAAS
jgi:NAD-dependent dihydropyrimidine dehydrogenase PreA subunit